MATKTEQEKAEAILDAFYKPEMVKFLADFKRQSSGLTPAKAKRFINEDELQKRGIVLPPTATITARRLPDSTLHPMGKWSVCLNLGVISICREF